MSRVDKESVDEYKEKSKKQIKKIHKENPNLSKSQLMKYQADPVISKFHPQKYFGAISESMDEKLTNYLKNECNYVKT